MKRPQQNRGFSLMELILSIGILGVVSTLGISILTQVYSLWGETSVQARLNENAEQAFNTLRTDLAEVLPSYLATRPLRGVSTLLHDDDERYWGITFHDDRVIFPAFVPQSNAEGTSPTPALVMYHVDRMSGALVRTTGNLDAEFPEGARSAEAEGVLHFLIEYMDAEEGRGIWETSWTDEKHPAALRVTLVLQDPDRPLEQVARKAVIPVHVR